MNLLWSRRVNVLLATVVVTGGFVILWSNVPAFVVGAVALALGGFLLWQAKTPSEVWAWATLILGLESLASPIITMLQVRFSTAEPTEQQMGLILTRTLFGMFSSIFWLTFSWGLFKWKRRKAEAVPDANKR